MSSRGQLVLANHGHDLVVREDLAPALRLREDGVDERLRRLDPLLFEPMVHVRRPRHVPDADLLLPPEHARRHARVDAVREPRVALRLRLNNGRRVHAGCRTERVAPHERVVDRHVPTERLRRCRAVLDEVRQVLMLEHPQELQVQQDELHRRVADAFTDSERRPVHPISTVLEGKKRVLEGEASVVMPVPIDADLDAHLGDDAPRKRDEVPHAVGRRVPHGVAKAKARRPVIDRHLKQRREHVRPRARRVFGHVRHRQPRLHADVDRVRRALHDHVEVPLLRELPDRARPDERIDLHRDPGPLRYLDYRCDVRDDGPARASDPQIQLICSNFLTHPQDVIERALRTTG